MAHMGTHRPAAIDIRAMIGACEAIPLTRSEIARRAGLSPATITRLANGERGQAPSYETVQAIRSVLTTVKT